MKKFVLTAIAAAASAYCAIPTALAQTEAKPDQIVVNDSGGATQAANRETFYNSFEEKHGIRIVNTSPVDLGKLRAMVESGNVEWTVTEIAGPDALFAQRLGLLEPLDRSIVDLSRFPEHLRDREYIFPKSAYSTVLGYRTDVFPDGGPKSWADFWDVERFPGPRTMQNSPIDNLEFALLADGVPLDELYPLDVDRAFAKMDEIKPHVAVWWTTGAQSAQLLIDQEAVIGTAWNGRYYNLIKEGAPLAIEWNQGSIKESAFGIPKGAPHAQWGQHVIAAMADAELQGRYASIIGYPGLNLDATQHTDPDLVPFLPTNPEHLERQFWTNLEWWADNNVEVHERWARWLLQ